MIDISCLSLNIGQSPATRQDVSSDAQLASSPAGHPTCGFRLPSRRGLAYMPPMAERCPSRTGKRDKRCSGNVVSRTEDIPNDDQIGKARNLPSGVAQNAQGMPELDEVRAALERALEGLQARQDTPTIAQAVEAYLADRRPHWKASSARKMELRAREIVSLYGSLRLGELTRDFGARVLADAPSAAAKRERLEMLSAVWRLAVEDGKIARPRPWGRLAGPRPGKRERFLDAAELSRFWSAWSALEPLTDHPGSFVAIKLLALTGCRVDEVCTLKATDIDWTLRAFRLRDSKVGSRDVPVGTRVIAYLRAIKPAVWVCPRADGGHVTQHRVRTDLAQVCREAKIARATCHVLRHTWATHALLAGVPMEFVRTVLGHRSSFMTERYAHVTAKALHGAIDKAIDAIDRSS